MSRKQMEITEVTIPSTTIASGNSDTTVSIPMISKDGMYSVYLEITGGGTLEVKELINTGNSTWKSIEGRDSLGESLTATSGDDSDGVVILSPTSPIGFCNSMKLQFLATTDSVTVAGNIVLR